jgi:predicted ATPase/transcriptional regulator with XRE-family HTH domain
MPDISKEWERIRGMATTGRDESFGSRLRRLREAAGLTQEELAERAGLSPMAIGMLERGQRRRPYPHTVQALGAALGISEEELAELAASVPRRGRTLSQPAPSLPVPLTPIIGRERDLQELSGLVGRGARFLTLTGPGGVGKTRLAVQVAEHRSEIYPDGVVFVALGPLSDATLVVPTVARTLGLVEAVGQLPLDTLRAYLRDRRLLLVLDNFEHVTEAAPEMAKLSASCPDLALLITSRAPLRVRGEQEYPVAPLALPDLDRLPEVAEVSGNPAIELFVERARAVVPVFGLTRENTTAVAAICRRLDGLPLAIELAAARLRTLSPTALLARLDPILPLLTGGARDLPERQRTMEATIRWSYELLGPEEQELFRRISVFASGFWLEAAEAVGAGEDTSGGQVLEVLSSLVEQSLVNVEASPGEEVRYRMLEPVRQYALRLLEDEEAEEARRRHAEYYMEFAERAEPELRRARMAEWLDRLESERDNLRSAVYWALSRGEPELAVHLTYALTRFFWSRGQHSEMLRWMEDALERDDALTTGTRARALYVAELMRFRLGGEEGLLSASEHIVAALRSEGDLAGAADVLMMSGLAAIRSGDAARAAELLEESHTLFESIGDEQGRAMALVHLGAAPLIRGEYARAEEYFERGLVLARKSGDPFSTFTALYHLALATQGKGQYGRARRYYAEFMTISGRIEDRPNVGYALVGLAECWGARGEPERAARLLGAADEVFESAGMSFHPYNTSASFHERYLNLARNQLEEQRWSVARAEGRAMSFEQAVAYALEDDEASLA